MSRRPSSEDGDPPRYPAKAEFVNHAFVADDVTAQNAINATHAHTANNAQSRALEINENGHNKSPRLREKVGNKDDLEDEEEGKKGDDGEEEFRSLVPFCVVYGLGSMIAMSVTSYLSSQITVIEKAFGLSSTKSGILLSANDIGFVSTILFASHFLKNHHIPRILALCVVVFGLSGLMTSLPHFITGDHSAMPSVANTSGSDTDDGFLCVSGRANTSQECADQETSQQKGQSVEWVVILIAVAMGIQGVAKAPRQPLSNIYVDNNSSKTNTGFYLGLMTSFTIFGPFLAITMGGVFNQIPVDLKDTSLTPEDPRWIGAWWLGFIIFGAMALVVSIPIFFFPASLRKTHHATEESRTSEYMNAATVTGKKKSFLQKVAGMPRSLLRVTSQPVYMTYCIGSLASVMAYMSLATFGPKYLENQFRIPTWKANYILEWSKPVYMTYCIGSLASVMAYMSLATFGPKYLENQFRIPTWKANYIIGIEKLLTTSIGTLAGGIITRRLRLDMYGCVKMAAFVRVVGFLLQGFNFMFGCDTPHIHGFHTESVVSANLSCQCTDTSYLPVCADGQTYFSPCHAGCTTELNNEYSMCAASASGSVYPGICESGCEYLVPFVIVNALISLVMTLGIAPSFVIFLRSVPEKDRAMGVGLHSFLMSLLVFLPSPIIFGGLFDSICLVWNSDNTCAGSGGHSGKSGSCSMYDVTDMRLKFVSIDFALKGVAALFTVIALYVVWRKQRTESSSTEVVISKPPVPQPRPSITSLTSTS